jgi:hypothetical protein
MIATGQDDLLTQGNLSKDQKEMLYKEMGLKNIADQI